MSPSTAFLVVALSAAVGLGGCATRQEPIAHRGEQRPAGETMMSGQRMPMDMEQMCAVHQSMMAGKSQAEQQAAMESHMQAMHGSVDPRMVAAHRRMMEDNCTTVAPKPKQAR